MLLCNPNDIFQRRYEEIELTAFEIIYQLYGKGQFTIDNLDELLKDIFLTKGVKKNYLEIINVVYLEKILKDFLTLKLISKDNSSFYLNDSIFKLFIEFYLDSAVIGLPTLSKALQNIFEISNTYDNKIISKNELDMIIKRSLLKQNNFQFNKEGLIERVYNWLLFSKYIVNIPEGIKIKKIIEI